MYKATKLQTLHEHQAILTSWQLLTNTPDNHTTHVCGMAVMGVCEHTP